MVSWAASSASSEGAGSVYTPLLISLVMVAIGILAAFDIGGYASSSVKHNTGFTPWGKKNIGRWPEKLPPVYKIVGWAFLLAGGPLLLLSVIALLVSGP